MDTSIRNTYFNIKSNDLQQPKKLTCDVVHLVQVQDVDGNYVHQRRH
jgi:hypothetical protein